MLYILCDNKQNSAIINSRNKCNPCNFYLNIRFGKIKLFFLTLKNACD